MCVKLSAKVFSNRKENDLERRSDSRSKKSLKSKKEKYQLREKNILYLLVL